MRAVLRRLVCDSHPPRGRRMPFHHHAHTYHGHLNVYTRSCSSFRPLVIALRCVLRSPVPAFAYSFQCDRSLDTVALLQIVLEMVRAVFQIKDIQRVPGRPGSIGRIVMKKCEVDFDLYTNELGLPGPRHSW